MGITAPTYRRPRGLAPALTLALLVAFATLLACAGSAAAQGLAGKIAFVEENDVWIVNADGSDPTRLTSTKDVSSLSMSPDGEHIAFTRGGFFDTSDVWLINSDGTGERILVDTGGTTKNREPNWSADGTKVVYVTTGGGGPEKVWTVPAPGGGTPTQVPVTDDPSIQISEVDFYPSGQRLVLAYYNDFDLGSGLFRVGIDGSELTPLYTEETGVVPSGGEVSPDGGRVVFSAEIPPENQPTPLISVATMDANDGSDLRELAPDSRGFSGTYSPDGAHIAYSFDDGLRIMTSDDGTEVGTIPAPILYAYGPSWGPGRVDVAKAEPAVKIKKRQKGLKVKAKVSCPEACAASLRGKAKRGGKKIPMKTDSKTVGAGQTKTLKLKPKGKKAKRKLKRALKRGSVKVPVKLKIGANYSASFKQTVRLKRR